MCYIRMDSSSILKKSSPLQVNVWCRRRTCNVFTLQPHCPCRWSSILFRQWYLDECSSFARRIPSHHQESALFGLWWQNKTHYFILIHNSVLLFFLRFSNFSERQMSVRHFIDQSRGWSVGRPTIDIFGGNLLSKTYGTQKMPWICLFFLLQLLNELIHCPTTYSHKKVLFSPVSVGNSSVQSRKSSVFRCLLLINALISQPLWFNLFKITMLILS